MNLSLSPSQTLLFALLALLAAQSATAQAQNTVKATLIRDWDIPTGTSPYLATVDATVDGTTLLVLGRGEEEEELCIIAISTKEWARAYNFRHEFSATRCLDAIAHPDGGFFVRGESPLRSERGIGGFSARIDADGQLLWTLDDEELIQAQAPPAGPGEFLGNYLHPAEGLAFDPDHDRLLAITFAERPLATGERPFMQAFVIDAQSGQLLLNGRAFGPNRNDMIIDLTGRSGSFLIRTEGLIDKETRFYAFDGIRSTSALRPGDKNWAHREIIGPMSHHPAVGTLILSNPGPNLLAIDDDDDHELWSHDLSNHNFDHDPGLPLRVWTGSAMIALLYQHPDDQRLSLRLLDAEDGQDIALTSVDELISEDLIDLTRGPNGELRLLAIHPTKSRLREYELRISDGPHLPDASDSNADKNGGCTHTPTSPPLPLVILIILAVQTRFFAAQDTKKMFFSSKKP